MSIKLAGSKFGTYLPLVVVDTKVYVNQLSCQTIQGAPSGTGDTGPNKHVCKVWIRAPAGAYMHCPAADALGPYDLKQLNYRIQSWLQTSCNICLIQNGPDSIYTTPSGSQHYSSHPLTVLAKNCVSILTVLGTCWVPNLGNIPLWQINASLLSNFPSTHITFVSAFLLLSVQENTIGS